MTNNTKSFIKSTLIGLLSGGAASALYSLNSQRKDSKTDPEFKEDEIQVPLSRRNFMKAVRSSKKTSDKKKTDEESGVDKKDYSSMSKKDLTAIKKSILRKNASNCTKGLKVTVPSSAEMKIKNIAGAGSTFARDRKGRFISNSSITKKAGIFDDASGTFNDSVGYLGGAAAGMVLLKMISDRIMINKKKRQVDAARRRYVDTLNKEVNDEDLPYYNKKTAEDSRNIIGSGLGLLKLTGYTTGLATAAIIYRIMENRRKEAEKEKDKDLSKYPREKTITYRFPKEGSIRSHGFFNDSSPYNISKANNALNKLAYPLPLKEDEESITPVERAKLTLFESIPEKFVPSDLKGRILINAYIRSKNKYGNGRVATKEFEKRILRTPGVSRSILDYLKNSSGALPELVGAELGDHWYTGPAKLVSRLPIVDDIIINKVLERTLPKVNGSTNLARQFLYAGGMV